MPRVRVSVPDELLQRAATRAQQLGKHIDELYADAIDGYVKTHQATPAGAGRNRSGLPHGSPQIVIEVPEQLLQRANKLAKRLGIPRDVMYSEALAKHVQYAPATDSALDQGHDLPSKAWRQIGRAVPPWHDPRIAKIKIDEADGLTVEAVMHAQLTALPATATVADVRDYFAASTHRRLALVVNEDGVYIGSLTPAHLAGGDPARPAAEVADPGPTVSPGAAAQTGRDLALATDARRVPVIDDGGRLVGVLAVTGDLQCFCGTTAA